MNNSPSCSPALRKGLQDAKGPGDEPDPLLFPLLVPHVHVSTVMPSRETIYCYHCARHHPRGEMRQIETKGGKKWRCIKSIEATKKDVGTRDAFGKTVTADNRSGNQTRVKARQEAERLTTR